MRLSVSPIKQFAVFSFFSFVLLGGMLVWFLSGQIEKEMAAATADMVGHQVSAMIRAQLSAADMGEPMTGKRYAAFDAFLRHRILSSQIARVKVWNRAGTVIYSDDPALVGQVFPVEGELREVFAAGEAVATVASLKKAENAHEQDLGRLLEIYVPMVPSDSNEVLGAYEVYLYYAPIASAVQRAQTWIWGSVAVALLALWGCLSWVFARASRAIVRQRNLAITDPLTGLHNRRRLLEQLQGERERSKRYGTPFALILVDVDLFKEYNDAFGHPAGDDALREVARRMLRCVRGLDTVARYGGDEFAILLPAIGLVGAEQAADRVRELVDTQPFAHGSLTVSQGIACHSGSSQNDIVAAADAALYQAKSLGRNRVSAATTDAEGRI
jgi:diguanylate cyclase (GGDEF)-like protein